MDTYNHTLVDAAVADAVATEPLVGWAGDTRRDPTGDVAVDTRYEHDLYEARRNAEMQRAMNTVPAQDYIPYPATSGGAGIGQMIGQKGFCSGGSHYYACKHEQVCSCGKTGRITVAPGL